MRVCTGTNYEIKRNILKRSWCDVSTSCHGSFFAISMFTEGKNTAETESRAKVDMIRVIKHFMVFGKDNVDPSFLFFRNDW